MKWYKKYFSIHHYIAVLKRQPVHIQHLYAFLFAGSVTFILAVTILYFDYGYWRDRYERSNDILVGDTGTQDVSSPVKQPKKEGYSPFEMLHSFVGEAQQQFNKIGTTEANFLKNKDTYTRESK